MCVCFVVVVVVVVVFFFNNFLGQTSVWGRQALFQKWEQVSSGGIGKILLDQGPTQQKPYILCIRKFIKCLEMLVFNKSLINLELKG